jgi:hypothetical protein
VTVTAIVLELTDQDALVGASCVHCKGPLRAGERVVIKATAPARHEDCNGGLAKTGT